MLKKIVLSVVILIVVGSVALFFWARSVLTTDYVRAQLAVQISDALGQPVTIGSIGASIYPRVTVDLGDVDIGETQQIRLHALHVGTDFRALLSRRIEHADLRVDGAKIQLPLPTLKRTEGQGSSPGQSGSAAEASAAEAKASALRAEGTSYVELVSIDEIRLRNVEVVSSGRTLKADIDAVPKGDGFTLKRMSLTADDTAIEASGEITNLAGPVGSLAIKAGRLDFNRLLAFLSEFAAGAKGTVGQGFSPGQDRSTKTNLTISIDTDQAKSGGLVLDKLSGTALVTNEGVTLDPISFGLFDGRYDGRLALAIADDAPRFEGKAGLKNLDMAALVAFAGRAGVISGRLSGHLDLTGSGLDLGSALQSARGEARVDLTNGAIANLNLVRNVILATSGRGDSVSRAAQTNTGGEKFSRLGATLAIAGGQARTSDLRFESPDVELNADGTLALNGSAVALAGLVQLSEALSNEAGRDLVRYTAESGRVTLPATVSGPASQLSVRVDVADAAQRAIRNKAAEEINRAIDRNLGGLFKRKPK